MLDHSSNIIGKLISTLLIILALCCAQDVAFGQDELRRDVEYLSNPLLEGRGFHTRGLQNAAVYVLKSFQASGLDTKVQPFVEGGLAGHNIIGIRHGNPQSDKYILVCAHYDTVLPSDGAFLPAADANASGVAAMLELSRKLPESGKNFIFAAFDGHTEGFAGAKAFLAEGKKISLVVNLDTMGSTLCPPSSYRPDFIIALGGERYEKSLNAANRQPRLRLYFDYYGSRDFTRLFYRAMSDHVPFLQKGTSCVMFTSGITLNTNKAGDLPSTLDYPVFQRRVELIRNWLESL